MSDGSVSPASIRSRVAAAIEDRLGGLGWTRTRQPWTRFPGADTRHQEHRSYGVWLPSLEYDEADRQRVAIGALRTERVLVRWVYRLRAEEVDEDTDQALDAEVLVVRALADVQKTPGLALRLVTQTRDHLPDGLTMWGEIAADVIAWYPLE